MGCKKLWSNMEDELWLVHVWAVYELEEELGLDKKKKR